MPRYQYTAINQQNKKLSGIVSAITEVSARHELNLIGLSILGLEEISETLSEKKNDNLSKWKFEALDLGGKKIIGSIRSQDSFLAYQRLTDEYNFKVLAIYAENALENEIQTAQTTEIKNLENLYLENKKKQQKPKKDETSLHEKRDKLLKEVDKIIQEIQQRTTVHQEELQPDILSAIKKEINKLLRLKTSSNIEYIEQICGDILKMLQNPQAFKNPKNITQERMETVLLMKLHENELLRYYKKKQPQRSSWLISIEEWQKQNSTKKESSLKTKFLNACFENIYRLLYERPEIQKIKTDLSTNKTALMDHIKIWFSGTREEKTFIIPIIKNLWIERMELKNDLKKEKQIGQSSTSPYILELHAPNILSSLLEESVIFTGWLLTFYLSYYFIAMYTNTKNFGSEFFSKWYLFDAQSFRYALGFLFILHAVLSIKTTFFTKNAAFSLLMVPVILGTTLFLMYNF